MDKIIEAVADIIEAELGRGLNEHLAETMRAAAFLVVTEIEGVTASIFGDAAASLDLHRQSSMNRYNESKQIWGDEFTFQA